MWYIAMLGEMKITRFVDDKRTDVPTRPIDGFEFIGYLAFNEREGQIYDKDRGKRKTVATEFWGKEDSVGDLDTLVSKLRNAEKSDGSRGTQALKGIPFTEILQDLPGIVRLRPNVVKTDVNEFDDAVQNAALHADEEEEARYLLEAIKLYRGRLLAEFTIKDRYFKSGNNEHWLCRAQTIYEERFIAQLERIAACVEPHDANLADLCRQHAHKRQALRTDLLPRLEHWVSRMAGGRNSRHTPPHNLPNSLTTFIGREKESAEIQVLFERKRLLTLTGAGGCGKTRLAVRVAADMLEEFSEGVWMVELASLANQALLTQTVAQVLGILEQAGQPLEQTLIESLKFKRLLLVLDNCEHLLSACTHLVSALLRSCQYLKVLTTSRTLLGVLGEQTYHVPSLSLPDPNKPCAPQSISQYEAVRLFIDRAQLVKPDFAVSNQNASVLARVCSRVDGIPLAIELAAARMGAMPLDELERRLNDRFRILIDGNRAADSRHQTLQATMDWSYDLLKEKEKERALLDRLSVFSGGWRLEAAEQVCAGNGVEEWEVLNLLTSLVNNSLVVYQEREGKARYRLLETVRQYAAGKLLESGERDVLRGRHRDYFLALAEEAEPRLKGGEQVAWLQRLEEEHENLRAALNWSLSAGASAGLRLCGVLQRFWFMRGYLLEGREWCVRTLKEADAQERTSARAKALNAAGVLARCLGDYPSAIAYHTESLTICEEIRDLPGVATSLFNLGNVPDGNVRRSDLEKSLTIWRTIGDRHGIADSLGRLGIVAFCLGDEAYGMKCQEESLTIRRTIGDLRGIALSLNNLGHVAYHDKKDYAAARTYLEESRDIYGRIGDRRGLALTLLNLGFVACNQPGYGDARVHFEQSLAIVWKIGYKQGIANCLEGLAFLATNEKQWERATVLSGAEEVLIKEIGWFRMPSEQEIHERRKAEVRQALGEEAFSAAWAYGRSMTLDQAIEYALKNPVFMVPSPR